MSKPNSASKEALLDKKSAKQRKEEEKKAREMERIQKMKVKFIENYADPKRSPFAASWLFSKMFFFWMNPIISVGRSVPFDQDMHYKLRKEEDIEEELKKFEKAWGASKGNGKQKFMKTLGKVCGCTICLYILIGIAYVAVQYFASFLIYYSIRQLNKAAETGVNITYETIAILTGLIILTRVFISVLKNQLDFNLALLGYRVTPPPYIIHAFARLEE